MTFCLLLTPSSDADANLLREGISPEKIHRVGNVMIDTLLRSLPAADRISRAAYPDRYILVTIHRPSNVDDAASLRRILCVLNTISAKIEVLFPIHPRTRQRIGLASGFELSPSTHLLEPMRYLEFLNLEQHATAVITDSGGVQEETTFLGVPCLTLRTNTERPVTLEVGTNVLVGTDPELLEAHVKNIMEGRVRHARIPPLWDKRAAERIAELLGSVSSRSATA